MRKSLATRVVALVAVIVALMMAINIFINLNSTSIVVDPTYGDYMSSFVPIKDKSGQILGVLGVDTSADKIDSISESVSRLWRNDDPIAPNHWRGQRDDRAEKCRCRQPAYRNCAAR